jgi:hypothetical protein
MKKTYVEPDQDSALVGGHVTLHKLCFERDRSQGSGFTNTTVELMTVDELLGAQLAIGQYLNRLIMHRLEAVEEREADVGPGATDA